ncbi:MAG: nucleotidyl transferase AbiEii/AbiGii toxin family protein, partial [bacterium]|nr:nucleotidyl transferase AbiEii/AbiGii toxin family protein [bacterium]
MIPRANITAWRAHAPWPSNEQVEQDLVLSRALVTMFT